MLPIVRTDIPYGSSPIGQPGRPTSSAAQTRTAGGLVPRDFQRGKFSDCPSQLGIEADVNVPCGLEIREIIEQLSTLLDDGGQCWTMFWRRGWDSNPRYGCPYAAFRVRCFQPLSHLSKPVKSGIFPSSDLSCYPICYPFDRRAFSKAPRRAASTFAAASACIPGRTWLYKSSVMATDAWPSRSCAIFGWTPLASIWVACPWRRSWKRRCGSPCLRKNVSKACVIVRGC